MARKSCGMQLFDHVFVCSFFSLRDFRATRKAWGREMNGLHEHLDSRQLGTLGEP